MVFAVLLLAFAAPRADAYFWSVATPTSTPTPAAVVGSPTPASSATATPTPTHTPQPRATPAPIARQVVGGQFDFIVAEGNNFSRIGSRFGEGPKLIARANGMQATDRLNAGDVLHIDSTHIVPIEIRNGIVVNLPQRMLFHFEDGSVTGAYPIAIGRPDKKWQTPTGAFRVIKMKEDPTWRVPASIQDEMAEEGKEVVDEVEPGPDNPLGRFWIGLSLPVLGIHGTNRPSSIYSYRTHGCIRLHPDDIAALFDAVELNDRGQIVYLPLMLARLDDGEIFVESHRDIYRRGTGGIDAVRALADASHLTNLIDWPRAGEVVRDEEGIARDVTLKASSGLGTSDTTVTTK